MASTSFMFMLVWVPEPVCQTESGKFVRMLAGNNFVGRLADGVGLGLVQALQVELTWHRRA